MYYNKIEDYSTIEKLLENLQISSKFAKKLSTLNTFSQFQSTLQNISQTYSHFSTDLQTIYNQLKQSNSDSSGSDDFQSTSPSSDNLNLNSNTIAQAQQKKFLYQSSEDINLVYLDMSCQYLNDQFFDNACQIIWTEDIKIIEKNILDLKFSVQLCKLLIEYDVWKMFNKKPDILCTNSQEQWNQFSQYITIQSVSDNKEKFTKTMNNFFYMASMPISIFDKTNEGAQASYLKSGQQLLYGMYYFFFLQESVKQTKSFLSAPKPFVILDAWNGMDKVLPMKIWSNANNPWISYNKIFYLPKLYKDLTIDQISEWVQKKEFMKKEQLILKENPEELYNIYEQKNSNQVQIRLLSSKKIIEKQPQLNTQQSLINKISNMNFLNWKNKSAQDTEELIIHIHGGGWVSMSSFSHQMYLRRWANNDKLKNTPIISIDYKLAPEYPYPIALDDCWQAYLFIIKNIKQYFNINPQKIILTGDSAGGNMALGICQLCMKYDIKLPDGLVLSYPAMNLSFDCFTPSILHSLNDQLVPLQFLDICIKSYMKDEKCDPSNDTLLSPLHGDPEFFQKLPQTHIFVGEHDILQDDSLRFLKKLIDNGHKNSRLTIYNDLHHGYLNWDVVLCVPETRKCSTDAANVMAQILFNDKM